CRSLTQSRFVHITANQGFINSAEVLLRAGANVNDKVVPMLMNISGVLYFLGANVPMLMSASVNEQVVCYIIQVLMLMIISGANVNAVKTHSTPLHEAALKQDIDLLGLLLEYGANVFARNNKGLQAIDLISSSTNPSKELLLYWM
ncbi:ankyrin repeat and SOCS box protein 9-like, partial [Mytilus edulis]|uniref:ankyrin repeat and SOCS box protein 9-like n=1 Tax=Mytilus edulis TaxID=6550 RepID=UPI0039F0B7D1